MKAVQIPGILLITTIILTLAPGVIKARVDVDRGSSMPVPSMVTDAVIEARPAEKDVHLLQCRYFNPVDFKRSIVNAVSHKKMNGQLIGGVVTHHLLADSLIAPFFSDLVSAKPELVFVVGPNHKRLGTQKINTGIWSWQTEFGVLETNRQAAESIISGCSAGSSFELLELEHSISSLVPYIKYYIPQTQIVPILLHGNLGMKECENLAEQIRKAAGDKRWIIIGSIDFSHYLTPEMSEKMDAATLKAIEAFDLKTISHMGNDYMDSPPSLMTFLSAAKAEGSDKMEITGHTDATKVAGEYSDSTTSYFTLLYYR